MPKKPRIPKYSLHKPSGRARVIIDGRHIFLGKYGSPESHEKYRAIVAELAIAPQVKAARPIDVAPDKAVSVAELALAYWKWAQGYYQKDGKPTTQVDNVRQALKPLRAMYASTPAAEFGPLKLAAVQEHLIGTGVCRSTINDSCNFYLFSFENFVVFKETLNASDFCFRKIC